MIKIHNTATTITTVMGIRWSTCNSQNRYLLVEMTGGTPVYCEIFTICSVVNSWNYFPTLFHIHRG